MIAKLIKKAVSEKGTVEVSRAIGVSPALVSQWQSGYPINPRLDTLKKLAAFFKVPLCKLAGVECKGGKA